MRWFRALMPREERFFDLFARHSDVVVAGAKALRDMLDGGDASRGITSRALERGQQRRDRLDHHDPGNSLYRSAVLRAVELVWLSASSLLESLLATAPDRRQRNNEQQDRGCDEQPQTDWPVEKDHRVA